MIGCVFFSNFDMRAKREENQIIRQIAEKKITVRDGCCLCVFKAYILFSM